MNGFAVVAAELGEIGDWMSTEKEENKLSTRLR